MSDTGNDPRASLRSEERQSLVLFSETFYPSTSGGAHTRWMFAKRAAQWGWDVTVFTFRGPNTPRNETVEGVRIRRPAPGSPSFLPEYSNLSIPIRIFSAVFVFFHAAWWFYRHEVDAIHSASHVFHWAAKLLGILYDVPVTNFIGYTPSLNDGVPIRQVFERVNFRLFMGDTVYCRTPHVKEAVQSVGNTDVRILHGILHAEKFDSLGDVRDIRSAHGIPEDAILIAFVGRLVPIKRPGRALQTIAELPSEFHLMVVGDGPKKRDLTRLVETNGLESRVTIAGELPHDEALAVLKSCDILQLTSRTESYGAVVFEALAVGLNVVAPPIGVFPSLDHGRLHVVPVEDHVDIIPDIGGGSQRVDQDTLQEFSMERYTEEILERTIDLCRS